MDCDLEVAGWRFRIGEISKGELVDFACDALVRGIDTPALRELAGLPHVAVEDAPDLFRSALEELGMPLLSEQEALAHLVRLTARQIVTGQRSPADGAQWLASAGHRLDREGDLRIFMALAPGPDDVDAGPDVDAQIVEAAQELLQRPTLRRWLRLHASLDTSPLTTMTPEGPVAVDVQSLPVPQTLAAELGRWTDDFHAARWGFVSRSQVVEFVDRGRQLRARLQRELGADWHVEYLPEPTDPPGLRLREPGGAAQP